MKKLLFISLLIVGGFAANSQVTFSPATFSAEDQVTITIDATGTPIAGLTDAYIWIFSNPDLGTGNDGLTNGSWTASSDAAKVTSIGGNKFTFTFTGTTLFGRPPAELKSFGFLLKKKDGSAQTPDYKSFFFDPLVFVPTMLRVFPSKVGASDVITLNFDRSLGITTNEQRMTPVSATITMFDDAGAQVGSPLTISTRIFATNIWAASFIPTARFTPAAGKVLKKFKYKFNGTLLDTNGAPGTVSSSESEVTLITTK